MNIHFSPIGHSMAYAQLNSLEHWLFSSDDINMPLDIDTTKDFFAERPLTIQANGHVEIFPTFIHYCLSKPKLAKEESSFTIKLAQIFSHIESSLIVDMLLTQNIHGQNCYDEALNQQYATLACFFETTIESYNLKAHNNNVPDILNAFIDHTVSVEAFQAKIAQVDPTVFEAIVQTNNGIRINCAQAILSLKQIYPNKAKANAITSVIGKEKLAKLLKVNKQLSTSVCQLKLPSKPHTVGNIFSKHCPTSPSRQEMLKP